MMATKKRKYHRKNKIFQRSFISDLHTDNAVQLEIRIPQFGNKRYNVCLLFYI